MDVLDFLLLQVFLGLLGLSCGDLTEIVGILGELLDQGVTGVKGVGLSIKLCESNSFLC